MKNYRNVQNVCQVCFEKVTKQVSLKCGCKVCKDCLFNWAKSYMEDNAFVDEIKLPCPFEACKKPMSSEAFLRKLSKKQASTLNEYLLRHYLSRQKDIDICPKPQCNFAGIKGYLPSSCYTYTCSVCGTTWKDKSQVGMGNYIKKYTDELVTAKNELLSNIYKRFKGNLCPNCTVYITKDGGCCHVVCKKCKHEFCWACFGPYVHHRHSQITPCGLRLLYFVFLLKIMCMLILVKLGVHFPSCNEVFNVAVWLGIRFGLGLLEVLFTFGLAIFSYVFSLEKYKGRLKNRINDFAFISILLLVYLLSAGYNYVLYAHSMLLYIWLFIFYVTSSAGSTIGTLCLFFNGIDEILYRKKKLLGLSYLIGSLIVAMVAITIFTSFNLLRMVLWLIDFDLSLLFFIELHEKVFYTYQIKRRNRNLGIFIGAKLSYFILLYFFKFASIWEYIVHFAIVMTGCTVLKKCFPSYIN